MEDNLSYLIVREIEETEYKKLVPADTVSEGTLIEDADYEISDSASIMSEDESDSDVDVDKSHWFPSLSRGSIIEYLDDNEGDEEMSDLGRRIPPFQNLISAVDAIIEELDDSEDEMDDFFMKDSSTRKRASPEKSWPRRREKAQRPSTPSHTVDIEVVYVQL